MWGLPQKQNARRAYKIRLCGHLRRYKKIVKKTYIICNNFWYNFSVEMKPMLKESMQQLRVETPEFEGNEVYFVSVEDSRDEWRY